MANPLAELVIYTSLERGFWGHFQHNEEALRRQEARILHQRIKTNVSRPYPPASLPYVESPAYRTGRGLESIQVAKVRIPGEPVAAYMVYVAGPHFHMVDLNLGTDKLLPRPWMDIAIAETASQIQQLRSK